MRVVNESSQGQGCGREIEVDVRAGLIDRYMLWTDKVCMQLLEARI